MKPNKSPSHDHIGSKVIKLRPGIFAYNLAKIYTSAWNIQVHIEDIRNTGQENYKYTTEIN